MLKYVGKYRGEPIDSIPKSEADHFMKCPACGCWFDMRDLAAAFAHDGPLPHPAQDRPQ